MDELLAIVLALKKDSKTNYEEVLKIIRSYDYLKIGDSVYLIYTADSPGVITAKLTPLLKSHEKILVIKITNPKQGLLTEKDWKWVNDRISQYSIP